MSDLVETFVMVLRKKQNQVSFLHVYHHITVVLIAWATVKYYPGGMAIIPTILNNGVHVFMYSYYFLSSYPQMPKYLRPIKPYITIVQMVSNDTKINYYFVILSRFFFVTFFNSENLSLFVNYCKLFVFHEDTRTYIRPTFFIIGLTFLFLNRFNLYCWEFIV